MVLTTIATFYLAVGIAITLGGNALMAGVALFALSFRFDPKLRKAKGKSAVWTERVHRATGSPGALRLDTGRRRLPAGPGRRVQPGLVRHVDGGLSDTCSQGDSREEAEP